MSVPIPSQPPFEVIIQETLDQILNELRGMRLAIVHMATQDKSASPDDFDMNSPSNTGELTDETY